MRTIAPCLVTLCFACSSGTSGLARDERADASSGLCSGLNEAHCNAQTDCHAVYTTIPTCTPCSPGGAYDHCASGAANCTLTSTQPNEGCGYGDVGCPPGFAVAFVIPDGNCVDGFDVEGCVRAVECP